MKRELLDSDQTAAALGVAVNTLNNWRSRKEGPPYSKIGHLVRYPSDMLAQWIESNTRRPEAKQNADSRARGEVGMAILGKRAGVQPNHRFVGHRTKQNGRIEARSGGAQTGKGRAGGRTKA